MRLRTRPTSAPSRSHAPTRHGGTSAELIEATGIPKSTADRALEDLALLGLVDRAKAGKAANAHWTYMLSDTARKTLPCSFEKSSCTRGSSLETSRQDSSAQGDDFSEELHGATYFSEEPT